MPLAAKTIVGFFAFRQVVDHFEMVGVAIDGEKLFKGQWVAAGAQAVFCFSVPIHPQTPVEPSKRGRQRRI